jgi:hypothetical protein
VNLVPEADHPLAAEVTMAVIQRSVVEPVSRAYEPGRDALVSQLPFRWTPEACGALQETNGPGDQLAFHVY